MDETNVKFILLDAKPDDLIINRSKIRGNLVLEDRTRVCRIILGRLVISSDKLLESGDISFSTKFV